SVPSCRAAAMPNIALRPRTMRCRFLRVYRSSKPAAFPENFFTVWTNVFERAGLQPTETLLVHGGSSGIGTSAIMMAHQLGSRVFATAGSAEKCRACEALGAERGIN